MTTKLLTRDSLADRTGGVWEYISASRLNLWLKCPLAFKLRYVEGVRTPATPSQFVGKTVHSALECFYRHRQLDIRLHSTDLVRRLIDSWSEAAVAEAVVFESAADEETSRKQAIDVVTAYLAQVPADEPKPLAVEAALEAPLIDPVSGENLGVPLVGVLDLVLPGHGGPLIADFKTTSRGGEPLEITHEIQLSSYSYLFRHASPEPEGGLEIRNLVKTKTPKVEVHRYAPRTDRHNRRLFAVIRAYFDALDAGRFVFRPGLGCSFCSFLSSDCSAWSG
jgi:CRISPR/Cas system-associated exonuclease Cas4 (RecB family)